MKMNISNLFVYYCDCLCICTSHLCACFIRILLQMQGCLTPSIWLYLFYRQMEVASGLVKFQNRYGRVYVQLSGNCKMWRSGFSSEDGGWLSTDVYVDIVEQKWHANLKIANLFVPVKYIVNNVLHYPQLSHILTVVYFG